MQKSSNGIGISFMPSSEVDGAADVVIGADEECECTREHVARGPPGPLIRIHENPGFRRTDRTSPDCRPRNLGSCRPCPSGISKSIRGTRMLQPTPLYRDLHSRRKTAQPRTSEHNYPRTWFRVNCSDRPSPAKRIPSGPSYMLHGPNVPLVRSSSTSTRRSRHHDETRGLARYDGRFDFGAKLISAAIQAEIQMSQVESRVQFSPTRARRLRTSTRVPFASLTSRSKAETVLAVASAAAVRTLSVRRWFLARRMKFISGCTTNNRRSHMLQNGETTSARPPD
jgi:hypothetical protein